MAIEQGLYSKVTGNGTVSALIGTRFYPVVVPQNAVYPCASYQTISGVPTYTIGTQQAQIRQPRIQINAWAQTFDQARALGRAIRAAIDHQTGNWSGTQVLGVIFEVEEIDIYDAETRIYQNINEVTITHL